MIMMIMNELISEVRRSCLALACLAILLCGIYPALVWLVAQGVYPFQANGSLVAVKGQAKGSVLLAQRFAGQAYFHPRPSAAGYGYDAANSGGSNLGPTSASLIAMVKERVAVYREENELAPGVLIPADAVTTSASGLDPHISVKNALLQATRVARVRGLSLPAIRQMIASHRSGRALGIFGETRVNVLPLNLELDKER